MMPHRTRDMFENDQEDNIKSTIYTIALDKFDLSMLTIENYLDKKSNDSKPLWNSGCNGFYNNNYCEFQIVTKNNIEGNIDSDIEAELNKKYTCYICNVLVPNTYETEHQKSMKHQMNLKITNNAVDRLKKNLNQEVTVREKRKTNPSYYFCESCVIIVKSSDKIKHELSKEHKISTTQDRLLNDLMNVYLDGGDISAEFKSNMSNVIISDNIDKDDLLININDTKEDISIQSDQHSNFKNDELQIKSDNSRTETVTHGAIRETDFEIGSDIVASWKNEASMTKKAKINELTTKKPEIKEEKTALQKYLDKAYEILQNPFVKKFKAFDDDNLEITIGSDVVKIMSDYFHSYTRQVNDPNYIICSLCNDIFHEQFVCNHDMKLTHLLNLFLPFSDKNCIRQRNAIWSHCIICNLTIGSSSINDHKNDRLHNERLKRSLTTSSNKETQKNLQLAILTTPDQNWHCNVCDAYMHINQVDSHIKGRRHQTSLDIKKEAAAKVETTKVNKTVQQIHSHLTKTDTPTTLSCKVCDVNIPNHENNINEHVNGNSHLANFSLLMIRNKLKQCDNGYICEVCGITVTRTSEVGHVGTERHKNNMKIKNTTTTDANLANQHVPKAGHEYCAICKVEVGTGNMTEHISGKNHKRKLTENESNHYCYICKVYVPRDNASIKLHENGSIHKKNVNEVIERLG